MNIDEYSDAVMGPILADMLPMERKKMLLLQRLLVAPIAHAWIDRQLALLNDVAVDPDWIAAINSDPRFPEIHRKLARWWQQQKGAQA
jgi:hypothetical protein